MMLAATSASLRAERSNPESFRGDSLDCFAPLAMTEPAARPSLSNSHFKQQTRHRLLAACCARGLLSVSSPHQDKGAGKAGRRLAPAGPRYGNAHGVDHRFAGSPGLPCANGFNGVLRALLGERCTIAPVAMQMTDARARSGRHITAGLDAQTPGVRTTRLLRPRTSSHVASSAGVCSRPKPCEDAVGAVSSARRWLLTAKAALQPRSRPTPSRPSHPSPQFVTIAIRPLSRARVCRLYAKTEFR
jgi:hypothetical protein